MNSFKFRELFAEYHKELFSHWKTTSLVEQEAILSQLIRSGLFEEFVLIDELILLHELIRDECIRRLELSLNWSGA